MGRIVGIDYGVRRIGLAVSDLRGRIASPAGALAASGSAPKDAELVLSWATEQGAEMLVLGLPLNMDGTDSAQTRLTRKVADELHRLGASAVVLWDERLSSFQADAHLDSAQVRGARRRKLRDALAAQVVLQSYLDAHP
jgi:putative Holliday junction resolvase